MNLRFLITIFACCFYFLCPNAAFATKTHKMSPVLKEQAVPFNLGEVILLESPFKHAQEMDGKWLLSLEPDRFLHRFHTQAGLKPKAEVYGGWESLGVGGQSMGHYMSACAMMYQATGDIRFREKSDYIVSELAKCQKARGTGYVGSILGEDSIWAQVSRGDIRSDGFDLNGGWVPWYVLHKIWAGLIDTYIYTGNKQAKEVVIKLSDWAYNSFKNLNEAQWQRILACEHGGMLEALVNVYALTGNKKYLEMSHWFDHKKLFSPLLHQVDSLNGLHANTQLPKIVGLARRYELTGEKDDKIISNFFWKTVTKHYTYSTGGNSDGEHFGKPDHLTLSDRTTETCNTYNMLKLTKLLFAETGDLKYADYYEKALYNHILASQNPETGMVTYYVPLGSGNRRGYCTPTNSFTCCVGTGFENHARYGEAIYFKHKNKGLFVNLYIPSQLNWKEKGIKLTQNTRYPLDGNVYLTVNTQKQNKFPIYLRYPKWATKGVSLKVNGTEIVVETQPGTYIQVDRKWSNNDKIELSFVMPLYTEAMEDNPNRACIKYGPLVLAGRLGDHNINPLKDIPVLVTNGRPVDEWIVPVSADSCIFKTKNVGDPHDITLAPFYTVYDERYIVYFDLFDIKSWNVKKADYQAYQLEQLKLEKITVDYIQLGEMQPERDHVLKGQSTDVGEHLGRKFRLTWNDGWFSFEMKVKPDAPLQLVNTFTKNDGEWNSFDILIDGQILRSVTLASDDSGDFYNMMIDIPTEMTKGKTKVEVKFKAHSKKMVAKLFGCRIVEH